MECSVPNRTLTSSLSPYGSGLFVTDWCRTMVAVDHGDTVFSGHSTEGLPADVTADTRPNLSEYQDVWGGAQEVPPPAKELLGVDGS